MMTSPCRTPAAAPGPLGSTLITMTPSPSSRSEHHHAESAAGSVERHAAFAGATQGQVKFDSCVDLAPAKAAPGSADERDCTECGDRCPLHGADGPCESAGRHRCGFEGNGWGIGTINQQKSHIGGRITADQVCRERFTSGQHDSNAALVVERLIGCNDQALSPDEPTGAGACGVDSDDTG